VLDDLRVDEDRTSVPPDPVRDGLEIDGAGNVGYGFSRQ